MLGHSDSIYMNGLNKLSKYTIQWILLFLLVYILVFLCSLILCNSITDAVVTSSGTYFLFGNNGFIMFILDLSDEDEKGIWDLFS